MKIIQICPGSGDNFYCENCLRDAALVKALRKLGHDVLMVPLYLPLQADKVEPVSNAPIFFGGVNVYLQQKLSLFRKTPRWIDRWFDSRKLLEWAGQKAGMTNARDLGETTISMLEGEHGRAGERAGSLRGLAGDRAGEARRRVPFQRAARGDGPPDQGTSRRAHRQSVAGRRRVSGRLGLAVCRAGVGRGSRAGAGYRRVLAVSQYYGDTMQQRLRVEADRMHVVHMGVELDTYKPGDSGPATPTIGFLSRMCPERGLERLVDAFILLKKGEKLRSAKLRISGGRSAADEPFIARMREKLAAACVLEEVDFRGSIRAAMRNCDFSAAVSRYLSVPEVRCRWRTGCTCSKRWRWGCPSWSPPSVASPRRSR